MNEKPVLFTDLDGTLFDTDKAFNEYLQWRYEVTIPSSFQQCGYDMERLVLSQIPEATRPTLECFYARVGREFLSTMQWHEDVEPVEGCVEVLSRLADAGYEIHIVTARQCVSRPIVLELAKRFFPFEFHGSHFAYTYLGKGEFRSTPKREYIEGFRIHRRAAFVDDSLNEIKSVQGAVPAFLLDRKGYHSDVTDCDRITGWKDLLVRLG